MSKEIISIQKSKKILQMDNALPILNQTSTSKIIIPELIIIFIIITVISMNSTIALAVNAVLLTLNKTSAKHTSPKKFLK